ncbi:hypothetical protein ACFLUH_01205 [Chloroflexota bacterium]
MQVVVFIVGTIIWLAVLWAGSIAFEATGMERSKARFQALSAITGTGFTTSEAESVVNHPQRRNIASRLIVVGTTGLLGTIVALILFIRAGLNAPSPVIIIGIVIALITIVLLIKLGAISKITGAIVGRLRKPKLNASVTTEEIIHKTGQYGVARLSVGKQALESQLTIKATGLEEHGLTVLAIERNDIAIPFPAKEEGLLTGDYLLCYGKVTETL